MNRSVADTGAEVLVVSQFTLYGDTSRRAPAELDRRRPPGAGRARSSTPSSPAARASAPPWRPAASGAEMQVALVNDGPVTLVIDR